MLIYCVFSGEYSSRFLESVFDDEEKALAFMRLHNCDDMEIRSLNDIEPVEYEITTVGVDLEGEPFDEICNTYYRNERVIKHRKLAGCYGSSHRGYDVALKVARDNLAKHKAEMLDL